MDLKDKTNSILGALLRQYRNRSGLTQDDLAAETGVDRRQIGCIEAGEHGVSVYRLLQLCEALGVEPSKVIESLQERIKYAS